MRIVRINEDKTVNKETAMLQVMVGAKKFTITEEFDMLRIRSSEGTLVIHPGYANAISVGSIGE